jgi:hypothetical protein
MRVTSMVVKIGVVALAFALGLAGGPVDGLAAEEATVRAVAAWSGQGWFFPVGPEEALFVGLLRGILFVEDSRGALNDARMVCPFKLEMHRVTGAQTGDGRCVLTNRDQHQVFAQFTCAGAYGVGCKGRFMLIGGTESFKGITGEGEVILRSALHEQSAQSSSEGVREAGTGIAVWQALRYRIP